VKDFGIGIAGGTADRPMSGSNGVVMAEGVGGKGACPSRVSVRVEDAIRA
jgi:hypothetical protein